MIADPFLQQVLTRPREYSVIANMNLNRDYISDALAAQVGGIGIAPGANINYDTELCLDKRIGSARQAVPRGPIPTLRYSYRR